MASMAEASRLAATKTLEADAAIARGQVDLAAKTEASSVARKTSLMNVGLGAALASAAIIGESVKMAADFQQKTSILVTAAGESTTAIGHVRSGILDLAASTGASWKELADGAYILEKAGYRDADMLHILKAGAQAAAEEGAKLSTVVGATSAVMHDYHLPASAAVSVTNGLKAAAGEAKATFEQFDAALGTVVPLAANAKISFADVSGVLAEMTQHGISADEAAQQIANSMRNLTGPNMVAQKMMAQLGISVNDVTTRVGDGPGGRGLAGTLQYLSTTILQHMGPSGLVLLNTFNQSKMAADDARRMFDALPPAAKKVAQAYLDGSLSYKAFKFEAGGLSAVQANLVKQWATTTGSAHGFQQALRNGTNQSKTYNDMMKTLTGGANGLNVALNTTMGNADGTNESIKRVAEQMKNAGQDVNGWKIQQGNFNQQLKEMGGEFDKLMISLGTRLLPVLSKFTGFLANNPKLVEALAIGIGVGLVAATLAWAGSLAVAAQAALALAVTTGPITAIVDLIAVAIAGLVVGVVYAYNHFTTFREVVDTAWHGLETAFNGIVGVAKTLWDALTGDSGAQEKVKRFFSDLPGEIMSALSTGGRQIADFGSKIPGWIMSGISTVGDFGGKLLGRITSGLDTGAHQLIDFGSKLGDRFRSALDEGGHQWSDFGGKLLGRFTSGFSAGAHQLADLGGKIPGWLWDGLKAAVSSLTDLSTWLWDHTRDAFNSDSHILLDVGKKIPGWLLDGVKTTFKDLTAFFTDMFTSMFSGDNKQAGGGAGDPVRKGGKSIIHRLVSGLEDAVGEIFNWFTKLPDHIVKWWDGVDWGKVKDKLVSVLKATLNNAKAIAEFAGILMPWSPEQWSC